MDFKYVSVVLYDCDTWHLTVREEHRLRMSEGRVMKRILEPVRKEVMGSWKSCIMRSFIICDVHKTFIRIKSRMTRWVGHVASTGEVRNLFRTLFREPEGKRTLGRPRCSWKDNTK